MEFVGTENCALYRVQFPLRTANGPDAWQSHFRAVLCLDKDDIKLTNVAVLPEQGLDISLNTTCHQTVTICRDDLQDWKRRIKQNPTCIAFCFYSWCYAVLMWKVPNCSISNVYRLVRGLTPTPSSWENIREDLPGFHHQLDPAGSFRALVALDDDSPAIISLSSILKLPPELRIRIWEYVGLLTPYSVFLLVAGGASNLASHLHSPRSCEVVLKPKSPLPARMITVCGTEYIQDLIHDNDPKTNSQISGIVLGVKFVAILGSICAIRVVGGDWETDWIGKVPNMTCIWYGMIRGPVHTLRFHYNDLRCADDIASSNPYSTDQIMWDKSNFPSSIVDPETALFDYTRDVAGFSRTVSKISNRRFFRYLSLYDGDEHIISLTVYTQLGSVFSLEAHFRRESQLLGFRLGCPQYFPLQPNERIAYAWLRIYDIEDQFLNQRSLDIQTTLGRRYSFGPYLLPILVLRNEFKWILLSSKACVSGFYYENSGSPRTLSLGIIDSGSPVTASPQTPRYYNSPILPLIAVPRCLWLSVAVLSQFEKVSLCHIGARCTGMMIDHVEGLPEVLGQWHSTRVSRHSCIYNKDRSSISKIYFGMSRSEFVADISFSMDWEEVVPDFHIRDFDIQTPIAWWFSECHDEILAWTGQILDIPNKSKMSQN